MTDTGVLVPVRRALVSVSDKEGLPDFCAALRSQEVEILSTSGTLALLQQHHIEARSISDYTDFPEILNGRVKTLHPRIHGGILGERDAVSQQVMETQGMVEIDLVAVNLYPFERYVQQEGMRLSDMIEHIDIGGPTMVRAAAKNFQHVVVVVDPSDYTGVLQELERHGGISFEKRLYLARKAFAHTAYYEAVIASYFAEQKVSDPVVGCENMSLGLAPKQSLRYGENPHQNAAFFTQSGRKSTMQLLQGKQLSFNNWVDIDAAYRCVGDFEHSTCVIVKHANPCGIALGKTPFEAYQRAYTCDPLSAFGGIIALNRTLDKETAETILKTQFAEVIIAPSVEPHALEILCQRKNLRVLSYGARPQEKEYIYKSVCDGMLVQEANTMVADTMQVVSHLQIEQDHWWNDIDFAWRAVKHVKSNAIVFAKDGVTQGIGGGQTSRVHSVRIAVMKAEEQAIDLQGSVMASDAFFPFRDSIDIAAEQGIRVIVQPGGSVRDQEVIDAANEAGIVMVFTGMRHFTH